MDAKEIQFNEHSGALNTKYIKITITTILIKI